MADAVRRTEPALSLHPVDENGRTLTETVTARVHTERYLADYHAESDTFDKVDPTSVTRAIAALGFVIVKSSDAGGTR